MAVAFAPPLNPCDPLDDAHEPRVNKVQFGDGYSARSKDGINADQQRVTMKWEHLTQTEFSAIWDFFVARGGSESFTYTLPWLGAGNTSKTYICPRYSRTKHSINDYDITAEWEEVAEA
jgi:phage-related protein